MLIESTSKNLVVPAKNKKAANINAAAFPYLFGAFTGER
jgi:hypothetical protein